MKISVRKGVGFGLTSGIITTLGLIMGLNSAAGSKLVVIAGVLTLALADSLSDSLGIHISEESGIKKPHRQIWESTIATLFSKLFFTLTFLIPIILFNLPTAIIISIIWGLLLITFFSCYISKRHKTSPAKAIFEHLGIAVIVIIATHYIGILISGFF